MKSHEDCEERHQCVLSVSQQLDIGPEDEKIDYLLVETFEECEGEYVDDSALPQGSFTLDDIEGVMIELHACISDMPFDEVRLDDLEA